jgi:ankyrin repeat protein
MTDLDRDGRSRLHYAALQNDIDSALAALESGAEIGLPDHHGMTPLHFAAQENSVDVLTLLLERGAPVDPADHNGNTPLSNAVFSSRGRGDSIRKLLAHGADARRSNRYGQSPIGLAKSIGNYDVIQFFGDVANSPDP